MCEMNIIDELKSIYADVSEWLKFAETKHAALFAFWTALLIGVLTSDYYNTLDIRLRYVIIILILIGGILNLISFVPFLNRIEILKKYCYKKYKNCSDNKIFYQSIFIDTFSVPYNVDESVKKYQNSLGITSEDIKNNKLLKDYMRQIIEVSQVATIKYCLFSYSILYTCIIFLIFLFVMLIA